MARVDYGTMAYAITSVTQRHLTAVALSVSLISATLLSADRTDEFVAAQMKQFDLPGLSLAVRQGGSVSKTATYGFADVASKVPTTEGAVYKIGSVSKQFLATVIMLLVQDGRVQLDAPLSTYLPDSPDAWRPITIRHLLAHTAGLVRESPGFDPMKSQSDGAIIAAAYGTPLLFTPGTKWAYSNLGYYVLAEVITKVSGRPWTQVAADRVFRPAGMAQTLPTSIQPLPPSRVIGYSGRNNQEVAPEWVALRPSGAFLSRIDDLLKWDVALDGDLVLSRASREQMWTPVKLADGTTAPYGFGWHVETWNGRRVVWHGGGLPGFTSYFARFLDQPLTVIVLANGDDADLPAIGRGVASLYVSP